MRRFLAAVYMRALLAAAALASCGLAGCANEAATTTAPVVTAQSAAQELSAHWSEITSAVALALLIDNASEGTMNAALAVETSLGAQISTCAAGTDPSCAATVQAAIVSFVQGLKLSPKAQLELQAVQGIFPWLKA